jgi:eukaryotic-like serine/threonine-protein kinase
MPDLRQQLESTLAGTYALERELGGGGMSRVFVATESALGRRVVVKVLPPEASGGVSAERFRREVASLLRRMGLPP